MTTTADPFAHLDTEATDPDTSPAPEAEAPERRQPGQLVTVWLEGADPFDVRITNRDRIAYEKGAARHKEWPSREVGPNFAMTFVCWNAAKRNGLTDLGFEKFAEALEDYEVTADTAADPTR